MHEMSIWLPKIAVLKKKLKLCAEVRWRAAAAAAPAIAGEKVH